MPPLYYSLQEAAKVLGVSPAELNRMREVNKIRGFRDGRDWKFRIADVEALMPYKGESKQGETWPPGCSASEDAPTTESRSKPQAEVIGTDASASGRPMRVLPMEAAAAQMRLERDQGLTVEEIMGIIDDTFELGRISGAEQEPRLFEILRGIKRVFEDIEQGMARIHSGLSNGSPRYFVDIKKYFAANQRDLMTFMRIMKAAKVWLHIAEQVAFDGKKAAQMCLVRALRAFHTLLLLNFHYEKLAMLAEAAGKPVREIIVGEETREGIHDLFIRSLVDSLNNRGRTDLEEAIALMKEVSDEKVEHMFSTAREDLDTFLDALSGCLKPCASEGSSPELP